MLTPPLQSLYDFAVENNTVKSAIEYVWACLEKRQGDEVKQIPYRICLAKLYKITV